MKKLIGYLTPCLPSKEFTIDLALSCSEAGLDGLELGLPFSDPVADGKIIEEASKKVLKNGFKLKDLFEISSSITKELEGNLKSNSKSNSEKNSKSMEIFWMGYANTFYKNDFENMLKNASLANASSFLIPDLPFEEAREYFELFEKYDKNLISFVSPNASEERLKKILKHSKGFIYLLAYLGITGANKPQEYNKDLILNLRDITSLPIFLGFGVDENNAKVKAKDVDGVIVGSAFVKNLLDESLNYQQKLKKITEQVKVIKEQINS